MFDIVRKRTLTNGIRLVRCGECGLSSTPLEAGGNGKRGILVVQERPTSVQMEQRNWFAGGENTTLKTLTALGLNIVDDIWVTAVLPCTGKEQSKYEQCSVKLQQTIDKLRPLTIITAGAIATGAVCRLYNPSHFAENFASQQYVGQCIPLNMKWDCWFVPVFSDKDIHVHQNKQVQQVAKDWAKKHLEVAVGKTERPVPEVSEDSIEILYDTPHILQAIKQAGSGQFKYVAWDTETTSLSPFIDGARILTVAMSMADSERIYRTVGFPFASELVKQEFSQFLQSDVKKIGANIKFDHSYCLGLLGVETTNWCWDVGIGARIMDCMPGNSGLKYSLFCNFGLIGYDQEVEKYMDGEEGVLNKLHEAPIDKVLKYNCMDALGTYLLAKKQHELLGLAF